MSIHWNKIWALFRKDMKDTLKNGNFLLLAALPLVFTALYRFISFDGFHMDQSFVMTLGLLMTLTLLPLSTMSMMIAEEKEKNTLRTLMLSNVSATEFLVSKSLVIFLLMQAVNLLIYLITGMPAAGLPRFLLVTSCSSINMILFGALIGILSKNQMSTGMMSAPFALLLLMPAMFAQISDGFASFARFIPTYAMIQLISEPEAGLLFPIAVIVVWTVVAAVLFGVAYRKKRLD